MTASGSFAALDDDPGVDVPVARADWTGVIAVISTGLVCLLVLARGISFIEIGPVANLERLLVPALLYWTIVVCLLRTRLNLPPAFLLLLAPGLVMLAQHRELDVGHLVFPLVAMAAFILPLRWRPIALSVAVLVLATVAVLVVGVLLGVDYRGGGRNSGAPGFFRDLPKMINVPSRTLVLSLPLILVCRQKDVMGRFLASGIVVTAVVGILLTGSRANMAAAAVFLIVVYLLRKGDRNWLVAAMVVSAGVVALGAFLLSGKESPFRWHAVTRMAEETTMLVAGQPTAQPPLARSIITASAISVIRDRWVTGHGNGHDRAARAWADENQVAIRKQVRRTGKWHLHIHGSTFIMAAKTGLPATIAFLLGLLILGVRAVRRHGLSDSRLAIGTLALVMLSQIGGHTLSKVYCLLVIGLVFAATEHVRDSRGLRDRKACAGSPAETEDSPDAPGSPA